MGLDRGQLLLVLGQLDPHLVGGVGSDADVLVVPSPASSAPNHSIDVRLGHEVVEVDLDRGASLARPPGADERW